MCWSKRGSSDVSTTVTTPFTPAWSIPANETSDYCRYPATECYQDLNNRYCSGNGKCCEFEDATRYCVCFTGYAEKYCQTQIIDPSVLESLEANAKIGIAVGVGSFVAVVLTALLLFFVIMHLKKKRNNRQKSPDIQLAEVDNSNNGVPGEESERMFSDSNHNTKSALD